MDSQVHPNEKPGIQDPEIAAYVSNKGIKTIPETIANHRKAMKIGNTYERKRSVAFLWLDDNPEASTKDLTRYMWAYGFEFSDDLSREYFNKYKTVKAERLKEKALWDQYTFKQAA